MLASLARASAPDSAPAGYRCGCDDVIVMGRSGGELRRVLDGLVVLAALAMLAACGAGASSGNGSPDSGAREVGGDVLPDVTEDTGPDVASDAVGDLPDVPTEDAPRDSSDAGPDGGDRDVAPLDVSEDGSGPPDVLALDEHLVLVVDGQLYPTGSTFDVGTARAAVSPREVDLTLSNPNPHEVVFTGSADEWLRSDPATLAWGTQPPPSVPAGATVPISILVGADAPAAVRGQIVLDWSTGSFTVELRGTVSSPPRFVAVGDGGRVTASTDFGATWPVDEWEDEGGHTEYTMRGVAWGRGRFVSVGGAQTGTYRISEDGITWRRAFEGTRSWVGGIAYGGGRFVTVGAFGNLSWSEDGIAFTETHQDYDPHLRSVAYGNGRFVAVGADRRAVTLDGSEWISDVREMPVLGYVAFGNGVFVATGPEGVMATSRDGVEWDDVVRGTAGRRVAFGGGVFVAASWPDPTLISTDGVEWTEYEDRTYVRPAGYAHGWFVGFSWRDRLWRSQNGWEWELVKDNVEGSPGGFSSLAVEGP